MVFDNVCFSYAAEKKCFDEETVKIFSSLLKIKLIVILVLYLSVYKLQEQPLTLAPLSLTPLF